MSRRSTKTAHVLGLITTGKAEEDAAAIKSAAVEADIEETEASIPSDTPSAESSPAPFQESNLPSDPAQEPEAQTSQNPLDKGTFESEEPGTIAAENKNLRRILTGKETPGSAKAPIVEILFNDHDPLSDLIRDQLEAREVMEEATRKEILMSTENNNPKDERADDQNHGVVVTKSSANDHAYLKNYNTDESIELDYKFLNVTEELVRERVIEVMETIGTCSCDRCIVDTIALAVTNLPSKCIVADKDAIFPLLSYYRSKFATSVHTELMKAAMAVKDNPHH